jgi:hypothetical protein
MSIWCRGKYLYLILQEFENNPNPKSCACATAFWIWIIYFAVFLSVDIYDRAISILNDHGKLSLVKKLF